MDLLQWTVVRATFSSLVAPVFKVTSLTGPTLGTVAPTHSTAIYAANDVVFGLLAIPLPHAPKGLGFIQAVKVRDSRNQKTALDLWMFDSLPTTLGVDNAAWTPVAGDLDALALPHKIAVAASDYSTPSTTSLAIAALALTGSSVVHFKAHDYLFCTPVINTGTPTYTVATDLSLEWLIYVA